MNPPLDLSLQDDILPSDQYELFIAFAISLSG